MEAIFRLQSNRRLMQRRDEQGREGNSRERQPNSPVVAILDENRLADVIERHNARPADIVQLYSKDCRNRTFHNFSVVQIDGIPLTA
jgi:hypothetical protein